MSLTNDWGGYLSDSTLDKMQRKFGTELTPRYKPHDPLVAYNMRTTEGCPCDTCLLRRTCRSECDEFRVYVRSDITARTARAQRRRAAAGRAA